MITSIPKINGDRLIKSLDDLSHIGALEQGGVSRLALSDADRQARDLLVSWMKDLDMIVRVDRVGNIIGIRPGESHAPPVMLGSHIDTVTVAGRYDGCFGVLSALECVRILNEYNVKTLRPVAITAFTNEEGVRYQPGMLGSAAFCGNLSTEVVLGIKGFDGSIFGDELGKIGYAGEMECGEIRPFAYLELHIEQGPILDQAEIPLGAVEAVVGISWHEITITGTANHAGTTPIELRHDAGLAAAKLVNYLREIAVSLGGNQRATCGMIAFYPNAINVIPGKSVFTVDLRNNDEGALREAERRLVVLAKEVEVEDGVTIDIHQLERIPMVDFHPAVIAAIEQASGALGIHSCRMISGAGHDAQLMAGICPAAMIFVPSKGGISHSPAEYTSQEAMEIGANVLLQTLVSLVDRRDNL
jgi:beta-ureidopropionase / N-carbamoyl-L-amino-acid hydrolase